MDTIITITKKIIIYSAALFLILLVFSQVYFFSFRDTDYNYRYFSFYSMGENDSTIKNKQNLSNFLVYDQEGNPSSLKNYLHHSINLFEFGSITCPFTRAIYHQVKKVTSSSPKRISRYFIYTREAHPGGIFSSHTKISEKVFRSNKVKKMRDDNVYYLSDGLSGDLHRVVNYCPSCILAVNSSGEIIGFYKTRSHFSVGEFIEQIDQGQFVFYYDDRSYKHFNRKTVENMRAITDAGIFSSLQFLSALPYFYIDKLLGKRKK